MKQERKKYSREFKFEAVRLAEESRRPLAQVARELGIHPSMLEFEVSHMCRWLDVSRWGFYAWRKRTPSERQRRDQRLRVEIRAIHREVTKRRRKSRNPCNASSYI